MFSSFWILAGFWAATALRRSSDHAVGATARKRGPDRRERPRQQDALNRHRPTPGSALLLFQVTLFAARLYAVDDRQRFFVRRQAMRNIRMNLPIRAGSFSARGDWF